MASRSNVVKMGFQTRCVESDAESIIDMVDRAREITFRSFARRVDWQEPVKSLGYSIGKPRKGDFPLHIQDDYAVSFHSSVYRGKKCYFFVWSAIEFVFHF